METWFIVILSLCVAFILRAIFSLITSTTNSSKTHKLPPGPIHIPIISSFLWFRKSFSQLEPLLKTLHAKYGPIVTLRIISRPAIFISDRHLAYHALVQHGAVFSDRPKQLPTSKIISSNQHNISSAAYGPTWRALRRNLTSEILHPSRIRAYSRARKWVLDILLTRLDSEVTKSKPDTVLQPVKLVDHFQYAMFCLLVLMCFGDKLNEKQIKEIEDVQRSLLLGINRFNVLNFWPAVTKILLRKRWQEFYQLRKNQERVYLPLIRERKRIKQEGLAHGEKAEDEFVLSYVDTLLDLQLSSEGNRKLEEGEIVSLCSEFLSAGTDTTSTALEWIMANLVKYPHIQERLLMEMKGVMEEKSENEGNASSGEEVKEEDLQKMPYLKAVILEGLRRHPPGHFVLLSHLRSLTRKNRNFLLFSRRKWLLDSTFVALRLSYCRASCVPSATSYGGWEELSILSEPVVPGESDVFRSLLVSVGVDDKKHVFVFILGFVCALAISRVKVSSIVVFPVSVLVFAIGFTLGLFRTGNDTGKKRRAKEEILKFYTEKLKNLVEFFDGIDLEVNKLKANLKNALDNNEIRLGDLKNYIKITDSISLSALNARNVVKNLTDTEGNSNVISNGNHRTSKKEVREAGYELLQPIGRLFTENSFGSGSGKGKGNVKQDKLEDTFGHSGKISPNLSKECSHTVKNNGTNEDRNAGRGSLGNLAFNNSNDETADSPLENELPGLQNMGNSSRKYVNRKEFGTRNDRTWSRNNHNSSLRMDSTKEMGMWESVDNLLHSKNYDFTVKQSKTASFVQEHVLKESSETYWSSHEKKRENNFSGSDDQEGGRNVENESRLSDNLSSRSAKLSEDVVFDKYIAEATDLLKQAKECVKGRYDEELAEIMLYRSSKLLSKAVALKPMSLLAVGQLGNTYLLHGELKLKISRELRALLSGSIPTSVLKQDGILKGLYSKFANKDEVASFLIDVCEECEELLVEAGRKYRLALSIDANDVRALYNWGLALSFRGQLIADIGPAAAFDADKVFLAAIDKFDAIMSRGNVYASDALYRWGAALQERSRLRPSRSKEKVKLLEQAKRLYEDALDMDSDNFQVKKALSSCISELDYRQY